MNLFRVYRVDRDDGQAGAIRAATWVAHRASPGWSGTVTLAMPGGACAFTVAVAVACVWIAST